MIEALWLPGLHAALPSERISIRDDDLLGHSYDTWPVATKWRQLGKAEQRLAKIWEVSMETCLEMGAVTSHHHGVGLARLPYIRQDVGSGMIVLDKVKAALDPARIMNPGKLGFAF